MKPEHKEGMLELENLQRMFKLMYASLTKNRIFIIVSKNFPINYLLISREKRSNFTVEKSGRHPLNQVIKVNIISMGTNQHHVPLDRTHYFSGNLAKNV